MPVGEYAIRTMTRAEVELAVRWARGEGWNPGLDDAEHFFAADAQGFLVGTLEGRPVGCVSAVRYGQHYGFVGLYIVEAMHRGQGYGVPLFNAALKQLAGRTIGLDGVVAQQDNYRKRGFELAHRNVRYQGSGGVEPPPDIALVALSEIDFERVVAYDELHFGALRRAFLAGWILPAQGAALGVLRGGRLSGYGVIRKCWDGYKVGPLFADDPALADALFCGLARGIATSEKIYLDVPEVNEGARRLAERHRMSPMFETARMYAGPPPNVPLEHVFGVTTFELG